MMLTALSHKIRFGMETARSSSRKPDETGDDGNAVYQELKVKREHFGISCSNKHKGCAALFWVCLKLLLYHTSL